MTVNELLQRLVELAERGRSDWIVIVPLDHGEEVWYGEYQSASDVFCRDETKEVVIE